MKKIKFRAWDSENKIWLCLPSFLIEYIDDKYICSLNEDRDGG